MQTGQSSFVRERTDHATEAAIISTSQRGEKNGKIPARGGTRQSGFHFIEEARAAFSVMHLNT
jgi:hypothetical protein